MERIGRAVLTAVIWIALSANASAQAFSWRSLIGDRVEALHAATDGIAKCVSAGYHRDFPVSADVTYNPDSFYEPFRNEEGVSIDLNRPVIAVDVDRISVTKCRMTGAPVGIVAHSLDNKTFRIEVMYGQCDEELRCVRVDWKHKYFDAALYEGVQGDLVDAHSDDFVRRHYDFLQSRHIRSIFERLRCYSEWFLVDQVPTSEFRCLVAADVTNGVIGGVAMIEPRNPGFLGIGASSDGLYAALQTYVDVDADAQAIALIVEAARSAIVPTQASIRMKNDTERAERRRLEDVVTAVD